eukprot:evm.model.scf_3097.1 EVM.evm.TU.scf_3097.1   scf_3097:9286-16282(+)
MGVAGLELLSIAPEGGKASEAPTSRCEYVLNSSQEGTYDICRLFSASAPPVHLFADSWCKVAEMTREDAVSSERPPVILVLGPAHSGKSTFVQFLINNLLQVVPEVGCLDTDVGQPEFTTPGLVSINLVKDPILGTPETYTTQEQAYFMGAIEPGVNPQLYLSSISQLNEWWQEHHCSRKDAPPLVVNTCGWVTGMGLDLLTQIVTVLQPSHVFQLSEQPDSAQLIGEGVLEGGLQQRPACVPPGKVVCIAAVQLCRQNSELCEKQLGMWRDAVKEFGEESAKGDWWDQFSIPRKNPARQRADKFLSWGMHCIGGPPESPQVHELPYLRRKIRGLMPWACCLDDVDVVFLHGEVPQTELHGALRGMLVGLATKHARCHENGADEASSSTGATIPISCIGIGAVVHVDSTKGRCLLLTDLRHETLAEVNVIQVGMIEAPSWLGQSC